MNIENLEKSLHDLNYRWTSAALALWQGNEISFKPYQIYEGYEDFLNLKTLRRIEDIENPFVKNRLSHALIDHYLQHALLPHETEMRTWMRGAAAHVDGEKIYFRNIIPWCQKSSTNEKRKQLEKETGALCKFLKPFLINYWRVLIELLELDLGYENYVTYCGKKKGVDYHQYYRLLKDYLPKTDDLYFSSMEVWSRQQFNSPLHELTRFDAMNLLGFGQFDGLLDGRPVEAFMDFFHYWDIDLSNTPGLHLELGRNEGKSHQAMCFLLRIPEEVHIVMKPEGGWIDLETLWHELGHGLSAVFTSPELPAVDREMTTSYSLSESFAFLLQNMTFSMAFLEKFLGLNPEASGRMHYHKLLKDLYSFRRYGAKFLAEYEMFTDGDLSNGERYADLMERYTGFRHQPESHLFDLVPEFYSLDYIFGMMAEVNMERFLADASGPQWIFQPKTAHILKNWWMQGNQYDLFLFLEQNNLAPLHLDDLEHRWQEILN